MNLFYSVHCPVCRCNLTEHKFNRHDEYACHFGCYRFFNLYEQNTRSCWIRLYEYAIQCVEKQDEELKCNVYTSSNMQELPLCGLVDPIIRNLPFIPFEWSNLTVLNKRIKKLIVFS